MLQNNTNFDSIPLLPNRDECPKLEQFQRLLHAVASVFVCSIILVYAALLIDGECNHCLFKPNEQRHLPPEYYLWPMPTDLTESTSHLDSPRGFTVVESNVDPKLIENAVSLLKRSLSLKRRKGHSPEFPLFINVQQPDFVKNPQDLAAENVAESYQLNVTTRGAYISAHNKIGAVYALQTLSQLITSSGSILMVNITDSPRFSYRGLLLDTARNYFTPSDLKRVINGMGASKMNVLHWHLYDSQSFPLEWRAYPQLHIAGAYRDSRGNLKVYTEKDVKEIVAHAFHRNVRVIPEFEVPGHNAVFGHVFPEFVAAWNNTPWNEFCAQPPCGQARVGDGEVVQLIDDMVSDIGSWFSDPFVHVGHDEVNDNSWGNVDVRAMMRQFETELVGILERNGKRYTAWDEVVDLYKIEDLVPKNAFITVWRSPSANRVNAAVQAGFSNIVVGESDSWYLDCSPSTNWCSTEYEKQNPKHQYDIPGFLTKPGQWHNWTTIYLHDILKGVTNSSVVKGGFGALWTETIKRHNLDRYLFPRLSVIGERLWSYDTVAFDSTTIRKRLNRFRASLVNELGIEAADLDYLGNGEGMVFRPEICDYAKDGDVWHVGTQQIGNPTEPGKTLNYCDVAKLYDTNALVHIEPKKVPYEF